MFRLPGSILGIRHRCPPRRQLKVLKMKNFPFVTPEIILIVTGILTVTIATQINGNSNSAIAIGLVSSITGLLGLIYHIIFSNTSSLHRKIHWAIGILATIVGAIILHIEPDGIVSSGVLYGGLAILSSLFLNRNSSPVKQGTKELNP